MPKASKLDPYKDQIAEWIRQGKSTRDMESLLRERGVKIGRQAVNNYREKLMAPILDKVDKKAALAFKNTEEALEEAGRAYAFLSATPSLTPGERDKFKALGEWYDRIARQLGLYPKEGVKVGVAVGVQNTTVISEEAIEEAMRRILHEKPASTESGGKPADTTPPTTTS